MKIVLGISLVSKPPRLSCCSEYALALVGVVGRKINVNFFMLALVIFVSCAFGILVFPLGLNFIMMLNLCKRLLQVLNLPVKCRKV